MAGSGKSLTVRITGDNKEFDQALQQSTAATRRFQKEQAAQAKRMRENFEMVKKSATFLVGSLGTVAAAHQGWNKMLENNESLADKAGEANKALTTGVNSFFSSLNSGNFASFLKGLDSVIARARSAYKALDDLDTFKAFKAIDVSANEAKQAEVQALIRSGKNAGTLSSAEEKKLQKELLDLQKERLVLLEKHMAKSKAAIEAQARSVMAAGGAVNFDSKLIDDMFSVDGLEKAQKRYAELLGKIKAGTTEREAKDNGGVTIPTWGSTDRLTAEAQAIKNSTEFKTLNAFLEQEGAIRKDLIPLMEEYNSIQKEYFNSIKQDARYMSKEGGSGGGTVSSKGVDVRAEAAAFYSWKQFGNDLVDEERVPVLMVPTLDPTAQQIVDDWIRRQTNDGKIVTFESAIGNAEGELESMKPILPQAKDFDGALQGFGAIADVLNSVSAATDNNASKMLSWGASCVGSIGQVISSISALVAARAVEVSANKAAGATAAGNSVAGIPIVGPILAAAAVASMLATFASVPKFATGGIVPGGSYSGDMVPVRVNSGEMIVNKSQQNNLWRAIESGDFGGGRGVVSWKLRGADLHGALTNYQKSRSL